ncbi:MAG: NADH-quinone oxidoreductase subunit B [Fibrobacteres bacterium]|nr:NADH-quinone oxidoreductase subunit B [Fibrobacterota bacterium]
MGEGAKAAPQTTSIPLTQQPPVAALHQDAGLNQSMVTTSIDALIGWGRKNSLWPFTFGTACCAIEFMALAASKYDLARFGAEFMRFSPRQSDLLIVAGTITYKQAPILRRIWEQMMEPRWVISVGACASTGGFYDCYCTLPGIDEIVPVDVYIAGCPPRPEAYIEALLQLQDKIQDSSYMKDRAAANHQRIQVG